jgi:hypothetical protein
MTAMVRAADILAMFIVQQADAARRAGVVHRAKLGRCGGLFIRTTTIAA